MNHIIIWQLYFLFYKVCKTIHQTEEGYIACHNKMNTCRKWAQLKSNLNKYNWKNILRNPQVILQFS